MYVCVSKQYLAINNQQGLIWHKSQPTNLFSASIYFYYPSYIYARLFQFSPTQTFKRLCFFFHFCITFLLPYYSLFIYWYFLTPSYFSMIFFTLHQFYAFPSDYCILLYFSYLPIFIFFQPLICSSIITFFLLCRSSFFFSWLYFLLHIAVVFSLNIFFDVFCFFFPFHLLQSLLIYCLCLLCFILLFLSLICFDLFLRLFLVFFFFLLW